MAHVGARRSRLGYRKLVTYTLQTETGDVAARRWLESARQHAWEVVVVPVAPAE